MNPHENPNLEAPNPDIRSSLANKGGHGSMREKRASIAEDGAKLVAILKILPPDSQVRLGNKFELIKNNRTEAMEVFRKEIEAQRLMIDMLDGPSADEALDMLKEVFSKETIH